MKTGLIPAVVPAPLDAARPPPIAASAAIGDSGSAAVAAVAATGGSASSSFDGAAAGFGAGVSAGVAAVAASGNRESGGRSGGGEAMAAQRVALSRLRIEALMLEAQMASATGDSERARAVARAVRTEAGNIRQALRSSLDGPAVGSGAAAADASSAVTRAQAAARKAAAEQRQAGDPALAPWASERPSPRESAAVEAAPAGVPASSLHRSAYEALRRAQQVLEELARVDWQRPPQGDESEPREPLVNALEDEDGALWGGYNGVA